MARSQLQTLTEPMYYTLLSLTKERYGYEIMQVITEKTQGRLKVGPGTLYTLLARFVDEGIIQQTKEVERRKVYIITEEGLNLLEREHDRLKQLVRDGEGVLYKNRKEEEIEVEEELQDEPVFKKPKDDSIFF